MTQAPGLVPISPSARPSASVCCRSHTPRCSIPLPVPPDLPDCFPFLCLSSLAPARHPLLAPSVLPSFLPLGFLQPPQIIWSSRSGSPCRKPNWPTNEEISRQRENKEPASLAGAEAPRSPRLASPSFLLPQAHSHKCAGVRHLGPQMRRRMTKRVAGKILRSKERE